MVQGKGILSGYDLVCKVLREKPKDPIGYLLACARDNECDFLEFKAGMELKPENAKPGETQDDLYWDYAQAVIALVNTKGGAFVVGVDDDSHKAVGLETNDPRHVIEKRGLEAYVREEVDARLNPPDLKWRAKGGVSWRLRKTLAPYLDSRIVSFDGKDVVLVLVKPCDGPCIRVIREKQAERSEKMPIRRLGNLGRSQLLDFQDEWDDWESKRTQSSDLIERLFDQLEGESEEAACEQAIRAYYARLTEKANRMMAVFTPLDARENAFADEAESSFYSPEAIEIFEDEDAWLKEESDGESDSSDIENDDEDCLEEQVTGGWKQSSDHEIRQGNLLSILEDEKRLVVSGEPGGGKTTCLLYYSLQCGKKGVDRPMLAIFIPMGQWGLGGSLESMMVKVSGLGPKQLSHLMDEDRLRLVVDAVNECPDALRPAAIRNIGIYLQSHPELPIVLSTRHPEELDGLGLSVFRVQPMDDAHKQHYLEKYLGDADQAACLLGQVLAMPGGETIAENPMLLRLVVEVYQASPLRSLPNGRAGLYRRSLHYWHKRESEKSRKSGERLPWDEKQTLGLLSELAYRSRLKGFRDIPIEIVREVWGADADDRLHRLFQGPIVYLDDEFVRFRHETFQEYLCAEYMIAEHELPPAWSAKDYPQWGMPMAYATELLETEGRTPPEMLWLRAWELNPWMGVAMTESHIGERISRDSYRRTLPKIMGKSLGSRAGNFRVGLAYLDAITARFRTSVLTAALDGRLGQSWYRRDDSALFYLVTVSQKCRVRWERMERAQISHLHALRARQAVVVAKNWIVLKDVREVFQFHAPESWDRWIESASPGLAEEFVDAKIATAEDFKMAKRGWIAGLSVERAIPLVSRNLLQMADLADLIPVWSASASVSQAVEMVRLRLCPREAFSARVPKWIDKANANVLVKMIRGGFAVVSEVRQRALVLLRHATPESIEELVNAGVLEISECQERLNFIKMTARPKDAVGLIRMGMAAPGDFLGYKSLWIEYSSPEILSLMVKGGLVGANDVKKRVSQLIASATPRLACELIASRFAVTSDFYEHVTSWAKCERYDYIAEFVEKYGDDEVRRMIAPGVGQWIATASAKIAMKLVQQRLATRVDFEKMLTCWKEIETMSVWKGMLTVGLVSMREFREHRELCLEIEDACKAISQGQARATDYAEQKDRWIGLAVPSSSALLIKVGLASPEDFKERIGAWLSGWSGGELYGIVSLYRMGVITGRTARELAVPLLTDCSFSEAALLIGCGFLTNKDLALRVSEWVAEATPQTARRLVRSGLVEPSAFRERVAEWKSGWSLFEAVCLILAGIVQEDDVVGDEILERIWLNKSVSGIVRGFVAEGAIVDVAGSVALLPTIECRRPEIEDELRIGGRYEFDLIESEPSGVVLSRVNIQKRRAVEEFCKHYAEGGVVTGTVNSVVHGGLLVLIDNVEAFLPASQVDVAPVENIRSYIGLTSEFAVIKVSKEHGNIVISRRKLIEEVLTVKRSALIANLHKGEVRKGYVKNIIDFGAFVDLDGVDGLLHITDMSWGRVKHPGEILKIGQEINVVVLDVDCKRGRVSLGLKQTIENPWNTIKVQERFPVGSRVSGKVVKLAKYGAFVEIVPGIEGLVHISELSWMKRVVRASDMLHVGEDVDVIILAVDVENRKIALSIRQGQENPWSKAKDRFPVGSKVTGMVLRITSHSVIVGLADDVDGVIEIGDMSWTRKITNPSECLQKGQEVEAVVLDVNPKEQRISLGLKQARQDPWDEIVKKYPVGSMVKGKVSKINSFGAFVELEDGVDGLLHISQISDQRIGKVKDVLDVGQEVEARVVKNDCGERRIALSVRAMTMTEDEIKALEADSLS